MNAAAIGSRPRPSRRAAITTVIAGLGVALAGASFANLPARLAPRRLAAGAKWAIFYGADADTTGWGDYDIMVLDPNFSRPLAPLKQAGSTLLGYLSLGEINRSGPYFSALASHDGLLEENSNWPDSVRVDVRDPAWRSLVLKVATPRLLAQGFDGLFLDTLDSPAHLEETEPQRYRGMRRAAVSLVRAIRRAHPRIPIMMNRGYALLPDLVDSIDAVLAESMVSSYDFAAKTYTSVPEDVISRQIEMLRPARAAVRPLPVFSLDYCNADDADSRRAIYARERALGHTPYVGTILLDQLIPEPVG